MGGGTFSTKKYTQAAASYKQQEIKSLFSQKTIFPDFDPLKIKTRESRVSEEHPDPTSIIIACDVTGSMGKIPEDLLKSGLGKIMESLLQINSISNPQVMFAAIGDTEFDKAPLQVTQFESDNRIEAQLKNLFLESGGGGNNTESYQSIWYFAATKTNLDSLKNGKKGLLFTMGDELLPEVLKADHIRKFIDKNYAGKDIPTSQLIKDVTEKYEVFHLIVQDTSTYTRLVPANVNACWQKYLDERAILVPNYKDIPEKIIATVRSLCELNLSNKPKDVKSEEAAHAAEKTNSSEAVSALGLFSSSSSMPLHASAIAPSASAILTKDNDNIPHLFICPISQMVMQDPVIAKDGYTYDRDHITTWFQKNATSPLTNEIIEKSLIPNHSLKSEIRQWEESNISQAIVLS